MIDFFARIDVLLRCFCVFGSSLLFCEFSLTFYMCEMDLGLAYLNFRSIYDGILFTSVFEAENLINLLLSLRG